jgi:uncharacterized membrane protein YphA (DoxX/SURF4 family)
MTFSSRTWRAASVGLRIALGAVFVYAAWVKLRLPWQLFAGAIADYQLLPEWAVIPLARTLPWAELALGLLLASGRWLRTAAAAASLLLAVFVALMIRAYAKGMAISCGCFGPGELISWRTLLRDGTLLAASLAVAWMAFARKRKAPEVAPPVSAGGDFKTGQ